MTSRAPAFIASLLLAGSSCFASGPARIRAPHPAVRPLPAPEERAQALAHLGPGFRPESLGRYGWRVVSSWKGFAALEGDPGSWPRLRAGARSLGIRDVQLSRAVERSMASARRLSHVDGILSWGPNPNPSGVSGKGVLIGVIDYGFDTHHPAFLDSAGRTRFLAIWDPNKPTQAGAPFNHGQLRRQAELQADPAFGENKEDMHGTLVASIAAGSDRSGPWYGVAPEAGLLGVNLSTPKANSNMETNIMQGIQWMFKVADSLGRPCVVNLSLGHQHLGPHDGTSVFDKFLETAHGPGKIIVGAAGNDGALDLHADLPLDAGDTVGTWCSVPCLADVWGEPGKPFRYQVLLMDSGAATFQPLTAWLSTSNGTGRTSGDSLTWTDPKTGKRIPLLAAWRPEKAAASNAKPHVEIQVAAGSKDTSLAPRGILMGIRFLGTGNLHAWNVGTDPFFSMGMPRFVDGNNAHTLSEIAGTSKGILTFGAWVTTKAFRDYTGVEHPDLIPESVGEGARWSGRGPTVDGRTKPELCAPGGLVVSALSHSVTVMPQWMLNLTVHWPDPDSREGRYMAAFGTSQAAPFGAGTVALMLEAKPTLTLAEVRTLLQETAMKDSFTGPLATPSPLWGHGKLDAAAAVRRLKSIPDVPVATRLQPSAGARLAALKVRSAGDILWVEGLPEGAAVQARLHDGVGRRLADLRAMQPGRFALPSVASAKGLFILALRTPWGERRLRILRD